MDQNTTPVWMPQLSATSAACKEYKHLYSGCGCIHKDTQPLTVHWKECIHATKGKLNEEQYHALPCRETEELHVIWDGRCQLCSQGVQKLTGSVHSVRRAGYKIRTALKVDDRSPPRQKPRSTQKPEQRSPEEIERRIKKWEAEIHRREQLILRRAEARRKQRRDAYESFIASERVAEVADGVAKDDRFHLFDFTGGRGGDLLSTPKTPRPDVPCMYCDKLTRPLNEPPQQLPCGCLVHRDCAADQFLLTEHGLSRQKARCTCGARFNLRQIHLDFEDSA